MPKRKADSWPASILADADVLSLDDEGRFVLCKVCHVHYAVHGGKKPKPVIMNSSFRTRAWDVHKERTNSHRMQKKQDAAHRLHQSARAAVAAATAAVATTTRSTAAVVTTTRSTPLADPDKEQKPPARDTSSGAQADAAQQQPPPPSASPAHAMRVEAEPPSRFAPAAPSPPLPPASRPTQQQQQHQQQQQQYLTNSPLGRSEFMNPPSPRRRVFRPSAAQQLPAHHQWQASPHDVHRRSPFASSSSHDHRLNAQPPSTSIVEAGSAGAAPSASPALPSTSSPTRAAAAALDAPPSGSAPSTSMHLRKQAVSTSSALASSEQRDGMMRWRNMHDDVTRALGSSGKRAASSSYPGAELRSSLGETEDFGVNHEKVAKKLKSLDDEYDAKTLKRPDVHYDRRSASYKQYWGTMRDMYTAPVHHSSANNHTTSSSNAHRHSSTTNAHSASGNHQHKSLPSLRREQQQQQLGSSSNGTSQSATAHRSTSREPVHDMTTPDDTGSSEDSTKTVVVHDQALVNAIDRLTGIVSKQMSAERHAHEASSATAHALASLTSAVSEMRAHQDSALGRLIELQEQRLQVMEAILQHKLRKEARSTAAAASSSSTSGAS